MIKLIENQLFAPLAPESTLAKLCQCRQRRLMTTMNISLPEALKDFVDDQVGVCGYSTSSEYVRKLIRKDRDRQHLRGLLLESAASLAAARRWSVISGRRSASSRFRMSPR